MKSKHPTSKLLRCRLELLFLVVHPSSKQCIYMHVLHEGRLSQGDIGTLITSQPFNQLFSPFISRKVAVTLPEFSFCFSKNVLTQSCSLSLGEMVPDIFVCWPGGGGGPFNSTLARLGVNRSKTL